jgi:hypothetical protein
MTIKLKKTKSDDAGKVFTAFRLRGDVVKYLNAIAQVSGESPAKLVEEALWQYLPGYHEKILQRRRQAQDMAHIAQGQTKTKGTK